MLKTAATAALGQLALAGGGDHGNPGSQPAQRSSIDNGPAWMRAGDGRSKVVEVRSAAVLEGGTWRGPMLAQMVNAAISALGGQERESAGWRGVLGNARQVAIKFNSVGDSLLLTNEVLARELVESIRSACDCELTLVEAPVGAGESLGAKSPVSGWADEIVPIDQPEPIAKWWVEADAVINVGLLKTHQLAGYSACLKNISHAVIKRPARYHGARLAPCIAGVWSSPAVHSKVRLNIVNALRVLVNQGPGVDVSQVEDQATLLFSRDPVACDAVALDLLNARRARNGQSAVEPLYLAPLQARGVGRSRWELIERVAIVV